MTVLYREMGAVSKVPVGEFRKVSWCQTHDAEWCTFSEHGPGGFVYDDSDGCWRGAFDGGMPRNGSNFVDDDCVLVEVWMEVV